jgi:hypothetical protein
MGTLEHESQVDFEAVGKKLQSGATLSKDETFLVFGRATNFASDLIDSNLKETYATLPVSVEVRSHMTVVVLDRMVSLYQGGSTTLFDGLKKEVCEAFFIQEENLSNERLYSVLSSSLDEYFTREISDEVVKKMSYIRGVADQVVPSKT